MKQITIADKTYPLYIGFDFVRELDRKYKHKFGDVEFGWGIGMMLLHLSQYNPVGILDFILAATNTLDIQPTPQEVEQEFEALGSVGMMELAENFTNILAESTLTKPAIAQMGAFAQLLDTAKSLDQQ